jgi:hypothetical protein
MAQMLPFESHRRLAPGGASLAPAERTKLQSLVADAQLLLVASPLWFDLIARVMRELADQS